jgi:hypothetical protein
MQLETTIKGYHVTLDTDMNGDGEVTGCWISTPDHKHSASLACLEDTGNLHSDNWSTEVEVPREVIDEISKWAEENGY